MGNDNSVTDEFFFNFTCQSIENICGDRDLVAVNGSHCRNETDGEYFTLQEVVPRVLSAEEFF